MCYPLAFLDHTTRAQQEEVDQLYGAVDEKVATWSATYFLTIQGDCHEKER